MKNKGVKNIFFFLLWLFIIIVYPSLISIYIVFPLFIGTSGLLIILGLEKEKKIYFFLALLYMIFLEINLSLPLLLLPASTIIVYLFFYNKLYFLKNCRSCIYIVTVIGINFIYFILLNINDLLNNQSSIDFNEHILYSIIIDIIAAIIISSREGK